MAQPITQTKQQQGGSSSTRRSMPLSMRLVSPRWSKVLGDITSNKLRSLLVILSIALGIFAVGTIAEARIRMLEGLNSAYRATNPFTGVIAVTAESAFDDDLVEAIRDIPGVKEAEGRAFADVRLRVGPDEWADLQLRSIPDWDDIRIGQFEIESGPIPGDREMLIERSALSDMLGIDVAVGEELLIETLDQDRHRIRLVGSVHDLTAEPAFLFGNYTGYISEETLEWLGESSDYTQLTFAVEDRYLDDPAMVTAITEAVRDQIEKSGREILIAFVPSNPGQSPVATFILDPLVFLLGAMGILMGFLSGFLVTNTISGLLTQQTRQIGVLKTIGARRVQVAGLYLWMVTIFGVLALVVAVPLAHLAAAEFSVFFGKFLNFDPATTGLLPEVIALQFALGLGVPVLAALLPVIQSSNVTIREALDVSGDSAYGRSWIDRLLKAVQGLPRPLLLSLRNTFRRKSRLALTLTTLTLAGSIFISVSGVQASINKSLDTLFDTLVRYDIEVTLERSYRVAEVEQVVSLIPAVTNIESINAVQARRLRPDKSESD
ncbi:MAG: ABC transporter permease, partial [Chloroflexaceae bacterium]|nr:ABC transporter permease [Chloroflexaceae bacterium]